MGRRKRDVEIAHKHLRIPKELDDVIEAEAEKQGLSYSDCAVKFLQQGLKTKTAKYRGFKEVLMSESWTCFECGRHFNRGRLAMYDQNTGATMCLECAIENELTTKAVVKLIIQVLRLKRDIKSLKIERAHNAEQYLEEHLEQTIKLSEVDHVKVFLETLTGMKELRKKCMRYFEITEIEEEKRLFEEITQLAENMKKRLRESQASYEKIIAEGRRLREEKIKKKKKRKEPVYAS